MYHNRDPDMTLPMDTYFSQLETNKDANLCNKGFFRIS